MEHRVFLDANVLFAAVYIENSGSRRLWQIEGVSLISSPYAIEEARRNLLLGQVPQLIELTKKIEIVADVPAEQLLFRKPYGLPEKDRPILWSAIDAKATKLLTGDKSHFGFMYGQVIDGVEITNTRKFLRQLGIVKLKADAQ